MEKLKAVSCGGAVGHGLRARGVSAEVKVG
jgi:hypothetical protein